MQKSNDIIIRLKNKLLLFLLFICLFPFTLTAQEIVNVVLVGDNGITEDVKKATSFIVVKHYNDSAFERLDYKMSAPLIKLRTYSDSNLTLLQGRYMEYHPSGELHIIGEYINNLKEKEWHYYDETGKENLIETYKAGELTASKLPDTSKKKDSITYKDEREAQFKIGKNEWNKYLQENLKTEVGLRSLKGGTVRVLFIINTDGKLSNINLKKSVEFVLDEEVLRVVRNSPPWIPAFQNGKTVKAYRVQPITFSVTQ